MMTDEPMNWRSDAAAPLPAVDREARSMLRASVAFLLPFGAAALAPAAAQPGGPQVVDTVTFSGNRAVADAAVATAIATRPGTPLAGPQQVKGDIDRIVALYRAKGLDLAISPDIGHPAPGHLTLRYVIDEHGHGGDAGAAPPPLPTTPPPPPPTPTPPALAGEPR